MDTDTAYNSLFGKERSNNNYGVLNDNAIMLNLGEKGPIAEIIIRVISIIGNIFQIIVFNFDACADSKRKAGDEGCKGDGTEWYSYITGCNPRADGCKTMSAIETQGLLYKIWKIIFDAIFGLASVFSKDTLSSSSGIIWSSIDSCEKCDGGYGFDLWYLRTFITILFPPFGVMMAKGLNGFFYILLSCILTTMFYFPGLIYSFAVINASELEMKEIHEIQKIKK